MRGAKWWFPSLLVALLAVIVVATAPNDSPTPADSLWGHLIPTTPARIDLVLIGISATLAGVAILRSASRRRIQWGIALALGSAVGLYLVSVLAWRLHAPVSAGNGG